MIQEQSKLPSKADEEKMWEQRRYEIAKAMLPTIYKRICEVGIDAEYHQVQGICCSAAIEYADELIKQLKTTEPFSAR